MVGCAIVLRTHFGHLPASPEVDWSGGATRRSGGEFTVKTAMAGWQRPPRLSARISTRGALVTYWDDPEPRRLPEASRRW